MIVFTSLLAIIDKVIIIPLAVVYGLCMAVLSICKAITSLLLIVYSFLLMVYGLYMGYKGWEAFSRTSKLDLSYAYITPRFKQASPIFLLQASQKAPLLLFHNPAKG